MQDSTTRVVLLVIIMAFGTLMLIFDLPFFYLLLGAIALALLVLVLTGTLKMPSLKGIGKKALVVEKHIKKLKLGKEEGKRKPTFQRDVQDLGEIVSYIKKAFGILSKDFLKITFSRTSRQENTRKIDALLDKTVKGEAITSLEDVIPDAAPVERKKEEDPFAVLVKEDLNPDLLGGIEQAQEFSIPSDEELGIEIPSPELPSGEEPVTQMDLTLASEEEAITIDETNDADEVKEILEAHKDELGMDVPLSSEDLTNLESINLDEIEVEEDASHSQPGAPTPLAKTSPAAAKESALPSTSKSTGAESKVVPPAPEPEAEMLSFGTGKREDDDLMAALRTEVKAKKRGDYASLVRDLKDLKIDAAELQKELEELLKPRKPGTR